MSAPSQRGAQWGPLAVFVACLWPLALIFVAPLVAPLILLPMSVIILFLGVFRRVPVTVVVCWSAWALFAVAFLFRGFSAG